MRSTWINTALLAAVILFGGIGSSNLARAVPWDIFVDAESTSVCDTVNAVNVELVVLSDTGEFVIITGVDEILLDTFVDADGFVYFNGFSVGVIEFADDGDGFRTLWWLDFDGTVIEIDTFTGEPFTTNLFPFDFLDVPCDACELWDDPADCDEDLDGVPDEFDFCPGTPLDEVADSDGCSCSDFDEDDDGVDNCDDECPFDFGDYAFGCPCDVFDEDDDGINDCFDDCPNTPFGDAVDVYGCEIVVVVRPPPVTVACGNFSALTMALTFGTLVTLRLSRRRY